MQQIYQKLRLVLFLSIFMVTWNSQGQTSSLSLSSGVTEDGMAILASYNYHLRGDNFIQASVFVSFAKDKYLKDISIPYNDFTVNAGYFHSLYKTKNNFLKISGGIGGVFGYEAVNNGDRELANGALVKSESKFIYGAFIGLDTDFFISDDFSLVFKANEYYHHNSEVGQFIPYVGLGIRYFFN